MPAAGELREALVEAGRRLAGRNLIVAAEGNLSVRLGGDLFLTTPAGGDKGDMDPGDLLVVDIDGRPREASRGRPSSEWGLHREIYLQRPDLHAVCHAHPPYALAFACARRQLPATMMPEAVVVLGGDVPVAPYATPGTAEVAASVQGPIRTHDALLLANHGAVTAGADLTTALRRMETLERVAQVALLATPLGGGVRLTRSEVRKLEG